MGVLGICLHYIKTIICNQFFLLTKPLLAAKKKMLRTRKNLTSNQPIHGKHDCTNFSPVHLFVHELQWL